MEPRICVSTYCFRDLTGPVKLAFRGPDGKPTSFTMGDKPAEIDLLDLPSMIRARLGVDALEIVQFQIPDRTPAYVEKLRGAIEDAGLAVLNVAIDVGNISDVNPEYRDEDLGQIEEWLAVAAKLGSKAVRVNASFPMAQALAPLEVTISSYRRLAERASGLGMLLLVENHGGISSNPETVVRILESVGLDRMKLLLDIGNWEPLVSRAMARFQGQSVPAELDLEPLYAAIGRTAPYAGFVHAKTHDLDERGLDPELDVARAIRIVKASGYAGPLSIEYEGTKGDPWEATARVKAMIEEAWTTQ